MISLGTDILEIDRVKKSFEKYGDDFLSYVYSPEELELLQKCKAHSKKFYEFLAGRLAAKEAIYKSLQCGIDYGVAWKDMSVLKDENGGPNVRLSGLALRRAEELSIQSFLISISHCRDFAVAFVSAET
ncbi:holo-[acyl-carrier-protein] synthase [bacterium]|nr:holo-[acyl-carrier-protein] synthase [bacterium]